MSPDARPVETFDSRAALHHWLAAHHAASPAVWAATWKQPDPRHLPWRDLVAECLCWGWIDSTPRRIDTARAAVLIAPRNPRSAWSAINKGLVAENRAAGLMQPAGEAAVAAARASGMWDFLDDVDRLEVPADLAAALGAATPVWDGWPRSVRRGTLEWIKTARQPATRAARIAATAAAAAAGQRPPIFRA